MAITKRPRLLIVDDEVEIRETMAMLFELDGFEVRTAENGLEALEILGGNAVDAVITDIRMPVCGGMEFLDRLRARDQSAAPPVFMISAFSDYSSQQCLERGAAGFFSKPFVHSELAARVSSTLLR
jgi:CheY-like chemotaxis protein